MNLKVRSWLFSIALASTLILAACGGGGGGGGGAASTDLNASVTGEALKFDQATLSAKAGGPVKVTLKNGSTAQKHSWVLVKGGDDVAAKVNTAADPTTGAVTVGGDVLATSKIVDPGGTDTVSFTAPAAGTYTFVCTVPGHYAAGMKGTFTST